MPALAVILGVHLATSCASAFGALLLRFVSKQLPLDPHAPLFSITSNVNFIASAVLAIVWSPSEATTVLLAFVMLLLTIFSIRYHASQFKNWKKTIIYDSFFMTSGNMVVASLSIYHLVRMSGRSDALANLLFSIVFLSLVLLNAVIYFVVAPEQTLWFPFVFTLLSVVLFSTAEAISSPDAEHLAGVLAVGAVTPAIVSIVHGAKGIPMLQKIQGGFDRPRRALEFVDWLCGTFHCVAAITVSMAVYLSRRETDSDVSTWYTTTLLATLSVVPLLVVVVAYVRRM